MSIAITILAAGNGTRMKSPLPKVLHTVAGKPILGWVLDVAESLGDVVSKAVVVQPDATQIQEFVGERAVQVHQTEQLGTGHAMQVALNAIDESAEYVVVLYGDHPFITRDTVEAMVDVLRAGAAVSVLGFEPQDPAMYGRLKTDGDSVQAIVEYKDASEVERAIGLCNSGVMAFNAKRLRELLPQLSNENASGEYYLTDMVALARKHGLECGYVMAAETEVMGVNSQAERAVAEGVIQAELRKQALDGGVMMVAPETVFLSHDTKLAAGVVVHPNVVFETGVVVEEAVEIKSFCHLERAILRKNSRVGPYARLRPGADVGENAGIGNFVEIKNAKLHEGVKAGHLSYIGDAEIGAETNIGAGTITCNYDGVNKHKTTIGANSFIGSNTSLVAPVSVGDGAVVAAGSTVLNDVENDALVRNDMPQKIQIGRGKELRESEKTS